MSRNLTLGPLPAAPKLARDAGIDVLSSAPHHASPGVFDDLHVAPRPYDKWQAHGQSKTPNALFAVELSTRLAPRAIASFSVHSGMIITERCKPSSFQNLANGLFEASRSNAYSPAS